MARLAGKGVGNMIWSRILMANGMRYDFSYDITKKIDFVRSSGFKYLVLEDGRRVIINVSHIVSVEIDGREP